MTFCGRKGLLLLAAAAYAQSSASGQQLGVSADAAIVQALAPELTNARLLTLDALTPEQQLKFAKGEGLDFRFERDLNGDGAPELLLLGEYQVEAAHSTFVLITTKVSNTWIRAALLTFPEEFIVGIGYPNGVSVGFCFSCDHGGRIKWTGATYEFEWYVPVP